jgi:hypothetical protein
METKTLSIITSVSMAVMLTAASLSIIGIAITGLYPGIIVLCLSALIPIASRSYAKKIRSRSTPMNGSYFTIPYSYQFAIYPDRSMDEIRDLRRSVLWQVAMILLIFIR